MARNSYLYKGTRELAQARANETLQNELFSLRSIPEDWTTLTLEF